MLKAVLAPFQGLDHIVNDGISENLCSLTYLSVDIAAKIAYSLSRGTRTLLAKCDLKNTYRGDLKNTYRVIHPDDRQLVAVKWNNVIYMYIDCTLPFGLRSAPKKFTAIANALQWNTEQVRVAHVLHYLPVPGSVSRAPMRNSTCHSTTNMQHVRIPSGI